MIIHSHLEFIVHYTLCSLWRPSRWNVILNVWTLRPAGWIRQRPGIQGEQLEENFKNLCIFVKTENYNSYLKAKLCTKTPFLTCTNFKIMLLVNQDCNNGTNVSLTLSSKCYLARSVEFCVLAINNNTFDIFCHIFKGENKNSIFIIFIIDFENWTFSNRNYTKCSWIFVT